MFHNIELFQLLAITFCAIMMIRAVSQFRRGDRTVRELLAWLAVWGGIAGLAAYPHAADVAGRWFGIRSGSNALLTFALLVLTYFTLRSLFLVERLEERLSELTRQIALRDLSKDGDRDDGR